MKEKSSAPNPLGLLVAFAGLLFLDFYSAGYVYIKLSAWVHPVSTAHKVMLYAASLSIAVLCIAFACLVLFLISGGIIHFIWRRKHHFEKSR